MIKSFYVRKAFAFISLIVITLAMTSCSGKSNSLSVVSYSGLVKPAIVLLLLHKESRIQNIAYLFSTAMLNQKQKD